MRPPVRDATGQLERLILDHHTLQSPLQHLVFAAKTRRLLGQLADFRFEIRD
jgi:hypothetical protein